MYDCTACLTDIAHIRLPTDAHALVHRLKALKALLLMIVSSFIYLKLHQIIKLTYQVTDFDTRFQFPHHMYDPLLPFPR